MKSVKYSLSAITLLLMVTCAFAQQSDTVRLKDIQSLARTHYPLLKQKDYYLALADNKVKQLNKDYLPQAGITGNATLQSEVTKFPGAGASGFFIAPDQYAAGLE